MSGPTNAVIYRCPTCHDVVKIVPPGFMEPSDDEVKALAAEHSKKHELIKQIVEGEE